ncbi:hypothetical protein AAMO2058_001015600 [Amorphochlora amoebiformis]
MAGVLGLSERLNTGLSSFESARSSRNKRGKVRKGLALSRKQSKASGKNENLGLGIALSRINVQGKRNSRLVILPSIPKPKMRLPDITVGQDGGEYDKRLADMGNETSRYIRKDLDQLIPRSIKDYVPPQFLLTSPWENDNRNLYGNLPTKAFEIPKGTEKKHKSLTRTSPYVLKNTSTARRRARKAGLSKSMEKATEIIDRSAWKYGKDRNAFQSARAQRQRMHRMEFPWGSGKKSPEHISNFDAFMPTSHGGRICYACGMKALENKAHVCGAMRAKSPPPYVSWESVPPTRPAPAALAAD